MSTGGPIAFALALGLVAGQAQAQGVPVCQRGPASGPAIEIGETLPFDATRTFAAIDTVLARLHFDLDTLATRPGHWVTLPSFRWPVGTERESWHTDRHPGLLVIVTASGRGDSTVFKADARIACVLDTPELDARPGSVSSILKVIVAMQVATEVSNRLEKAPQAGR